MMHTPGPWRVYHRKPYVRVLRDRQGKGDETGSVQICHMAGPENADLWEFSHKRWRADAILIAAAPNLLAGCMLAVKLLHGTSDAALIQDAIDIALGDDE